MTASLRVFCILIDKWIHTGVGVVCVESRIVVCASCFEEKAGKLASSYDKMSDALALPI
jgi:hypothetical protein